MKSIRQLGSLTVVLGIMFFLITPIEGSANWWDKLGKPQYGGTLTMRGLFDAPSFDPASPLGSENVLVWFDSLFGPDWTLDRSIFDFSSGFIPAEYIQGVLAESWERNNPLTITVKLRKGVHFQNKPPVNGRELTAEDVEYTYDRLMGKGEFSVANPFWGAVYSQVEKVVATDKYTVEFRLKGPSAWATYQVLCGEAFGAAVIVPREWVELGPPPAAAPPPGAGPPKGVPPKGGPPKGGAPAGEMSPLQDWKNAVGTGPFMLTDYKTDVSITYSRNPDYWGHDERYPENQLPYIDDFRYLRIPDTATALAAIRTGKMDMSGRGRGSELNYPQISPLLKSNPEIKLVTYPGNGFTLEIRVDKKPFTDINVRKAMQMSLDRKAIANSIYGGLVKGEVCGMLLPIYPGWTTPYSEWPKELQEEYSYNPEKSKKLLAKAGFPDGFSTHVLAAASDNLELLQVIKSYLTDIGIDMDIRVLDSGAAVRSMVGADKHEQMTTSGKMGMAIGPDKLLSFRVSTNDRDNWPRFKDPYYDDLVKKFLSEPDMEKAKKIFNEADNYVIGQHLNLVTVLSKIFSLQHERVKGLSNEQTTVFFGFYPARMWLDPK